MLANIRLSTVAHSCVDDIKIGVNVLYIGVNACPREQIKMLTKCERGKGSQVS